MCHVNVMKERMKNTFKRLLASVLVLSASNCLQANAVNTNKTFLSPRPVGVNLPQEQTTFQELYHRKRAKAFGGNLQVAGFWQTTAKSKDIAKYFLFSKKDTITLTKTGGATNAVNSVTDLDLGYIIHSCGVPVDDANRSATVHLDPEQNVYGLRFDYYKDLSKVLDGLYAYINAPVVTIENNLNPTIASKETFTAGTVVDGTSTPAVQDILTKYFSGDFANTTVAANLQTNLNYARINGKQRDVGIADVDLALGYRFLDNEEYKLGIAIATTLPTGTEQTGRYLFETTVGNGKHFAIGADLSGQLRIWGDWDKNLTLVAQGKYRYLFAHEHTRTLGIKGKNWGQYLLLAPSNVADNVQATLVPAANVTTLNVDVTPGSQFDGILELCYNNGNITLDAGYNLYLRERETVKQKAFITDGAYAIAARNLNVAANGHDALLLPVVFSVANDGMDGAAAAGLGSIIKNSSLDLSNATTPSQITHGVYGNLGYIFRQNKYPFMVSAGGKYDWPSKNSALQQWGLWLKMGVGF